MLKIDSDLTPELRGRNRKEKEGEESEEV